MGWQDLRYDYAGARVLVTGGTSGLGAAIAEAPAMRGRHVFVVGGGNSAGQAAVYLASPRSGSTTGVELAVDGGMQGLRLRPR